VNKLSLLNNTPVDLVYKYIDLSDPALNRTDSVRKDFDNNELRYSIRSAKIFHGFGTFISLCLMSV
jgi:hypothetical protein